jgi:hypothetical protein
MKDRIKKLLNTLPKNTIFNDDFVFDYFQKHPTFSEKIDKGFIGFCIKKNEWNYSYHIANSEDVFTPISYNYNVKESEATRLNKALRNAVQTYIDKVRNTLTFGISRCEITNEILTKENTHIDHYDLDFKDLVKNFTSEYTNIDVYKKGVKFYLTNEDVKAKWIEYHNKNTNLRAVTATANLARNCKKT